MERSPNPVNLNLNCGVRWSRSGGAQMVENAFLVIGFAKGRTRDRASVV